MKHLRSYRAIVAIAMMLIGWLPSLAHDFEVGGIFYNKTSDNTVAVTCKGNYYFSYDDEYSGNVVIPSSVDYNGTTYSVTSIGEGAFFHCSSLTSAVIGNSVTSIGDEAFEDCESLTSVVIGNSVTSIGDYAFYICSSLTSIEIPNSVTSIGDEAFNWCESLTSVVVDSGNTKYDSRNGCNAIIETASNTLIAGCQNTIIPNSVTSIGKLAFSSCISLTSIEIPNSVTSIGDDAFSHCSSLTSAVIGNSVTSIGESAFAYCDSLTSIEIPNSVTSIGKLAFSSCKSLISIVVDAGNTKYDSRNGCNAIIETASNTLIAGCQNTIIPNSVTSIGDDAFAECDSLTSIEIPNSVTSIGNKAFEGCSSLTSIEIGNSVTSIGKYAFEYCTRLTSVVWNAIKCSDFYSNNIPFTNCPNITSFTFGDEVEYIPEYLCYNLSGLTSIEIPNSVTSIGKLAFYGCSSLTSVVWNAKKCSDFTGSKNSPFKNSTNITSFTFGDSAEHIPAYLCYEMSKLTSIKIPNSVTSIGSSTFQGCSGLTNVVWNAKKCSDFTSSENRPFIDSENITSFTFGDSVEHIPAYLCYGMSGLTSIEIPNSVTSIGKLAFYGCSSLTSIEIPHNVTSIGSSTFQGCTGLTSVRIGNRVTNIGSSAFSGCSSLTSIEIPHNVTSIGKLAFYGCSSLTSVLWNAKKCSDFTSSENRPFFDSENITSFTFGDSVEHIPAYLCYGMSGLTNLEIPNSTTSIGESAFYNGEKLTILVLGNSVILIEKDAFKGCDNIKKIDSKATKAPTIENEDQFSENVYAKADLFVPTGYEDNYKYAYAWSEFYNIKGKDFSVKATSISLDKNEVSLKPTQTVALTETIQPYDTSNKKVIWSSSNESVATIDANGLVTAIAVGEATITATTTDGSNLSATCKVTVVPTLAVSIEVTPNSVEAEENSEVQLSVNILPENATYKSVEWSSSNDAIASVNANGLVKIRKEGNVVITATTTDGSNLSATCHINVYSGIDDVEGDNVIVATIGDNIVVKNAKLGSVVNVYASNGALIKSMTATDGSVVIEAPIKGIYVITIDGKSFKVMVK